MGMEAFHWGYFLCTTLWESALQTPVLLQAPVTLQALDQFAHLTHVEGKQDRRDMEMTYSFSIKVCRRRFLWSICFLKINGLALIFVFSG